MYNEFYIQFTLEYLRYNILFYFIKVLRLILIWCPLIGKSNISTFSGPISSASILYDRTTVEIILFIISMPKFRPENI